ncbi:MAG: hypothetical protein HZB82_03980 [Deltaproteobacteria bacterium]|nr:hypothetical protein [Deltaproteobacteria bacterium]
MRLFSLALPYLLIVTFYSGEFNNFTARKVQTINESPYAGSAVALISAYDTDKHTEKEFEGAVNLIKKISKKHIWPWVFFNRLVGFKEGKDGQSLGKISDKPYFKRIKGIDIYNEAGALEDFYNIWRISLKSAKRLGSPGIIIDPEPYNNYKDYQLSYLAKELGRPEEEVKQRLKAVGAELADIAEKEYPDATLWFLLTGFANPTRKLNPFASEEYTTVTYIIEGMLIRAKEKGLLIKIISGGESSLGYCHENYEAFQKRISGRNEKYGPLLSAYPNLRLGGVIAPWADPAKRFDWMLKWRCGESEFKDINDFKKPIELLLRSYDYVWLYGAGVAPFDPYDAGVAVPYNKAIKDVMKSIPRR